LGSFCLEIRLALRLMRRAPVFTAIAILSLALGIGANTAIFSLVDTLMLRRLPVRDPRSVVELLRRFPGDPALNAFDTKLYEYLRDNNRAFSSVVAASSQPVSVHENGQPAEPASATYVSPDFYSSLGMSAAHGRLVGATDTTAAVISYAWWKSRYNLDPAVLGKVLFVDNAQFAIAGVAPREFAGLQPGFQQDLWLPMASRPRLESVSLMARLRPGVTIAQARKEMTALYARALAEKIAANRFAGNMTMEVEPAGAGLSMLRQQFAQPLLIVMAIVGLLLLIACTNVASMLLARGAGRRREIAVRLAVGASRVDLLRQALTESLLLSGAGTLFGIGVAYFGATALTRILESGRQFGPAMHIDVQLDLNVLIFTAGIGILTGVLFGLAPTLQAFSAAPIHAMREAGKAGDTRTRRLMGKTLVVAQVALSLVLLSSATIFIRHLAEGYANLGFRRDHVLLASLDPSRSGLNRDQLAAGYRELLDRVAAIPGVRTVSLAGVTPVSGAGASRDASVEGYTPRPGELRYLSLNLVTPHYFDTFGTPFLTGRNFTDHDVGGSRVLIVNQTLARRFFGGVSPLGKQIRFDGDDFAYEIVGVVADSKYHDMREASGSTVYFHAFQYPRLISHQLALRSTIDPAAVAPEVRRTIGAVLKTVTIRRMTTLEDQVDASIVPERLIVTLSSLFGALGGLLAAMGLYGLLAYTVARRVNEIGVRMALGATRPRILTMVLRDAFLTVAAGLIIGIPLTLWSKRLAVAMVPDLPANIALPILWSVIAMAAIALLAAVVPAQRASRVDPMEALRQD
jgi:putative ABC transport system permease protein